MLVPWLFCLAALVRICSSFEGCSMYGNCGKKSLFGASLPCPVGAEFEPPAAEKDDLKFLADLCGDEFRDYEQPCCTREQMEALKANLQKAESIIASCPACMKNFVTLFCHFTCSPDQRAFVDITSTDESLDGREIVSELDFFLNSSWASSFYDSCKNVKFSATNGYAMDLIGGGASNFSDFMKFLGDKKPALGGSPFQINFEFDTFSNKIDPFNEDVYACDDNRYKCTCTDCKESCPSLAPISSSHCKVGNMPCASFSLLVFYGVAVIAIGLWHIPIIREKRNKPTNIIQESEPLLANENPAQNLNDDELFVEYATERNTVNDKIASLVCRFVSICIRNPISVLSCTAIFLSVLLIALLVYGDLETDPVNLWVNSKSSKFQEKQYFDENFGPFYRTEQIFIINETGPVLEYETLHWWFSVEQEITQTLISSENVSYQDICFRPTTDSTCVIESMTQYFQGVLPDKSSWKQQLKLCVDSPVNCLPSFQQPLKPNVLFSDEDVLRSNALVVTLLVSNHSESTVLWERELERYLLSLDVPEGLRLSFNTEMSLEKELNSSNDIFVVSASYLVMFFYASWALKRQSGGTRYLLGCAGVLIVFSSVIAASGVLSLFNVKSTLILAEVIPFLILAVGIDNIFLITHEFDRVNAESSSLSLDEKILKAVKRIAPSIVFSLLCQGGSFLISTVVEMPAVRNFAICAAVAICFNVLLQLSCYICVLQFYEKYYDTATVEYAIEDTTESSPLVQRYFTLISKKRRILGVFVSWFLISLALIPYTEYGLDQTMAVPQDSYLVDYFQDVYQYLNVGPPVYFVVRGLDLTKRSEQQKICGKFTSCNQYSLGNVLEMERSRSSLSDPVANWYDDFMMFMNPELDQCCRVKKGTDDMCPPNFPPRRCETCFKQGDWDYNMTGFPQGEDFMRYFGIWINSPSDPCPLGGKAPYSSAVVYNETGIVASTFRTGHSPLRSQEDYIKAYNDAERISQELKDLDVFAYSPFYIFFVQYATIVPLTLKLLLASMLLIFIASAWILRLVKTSLILSGTVAMIITDIGALMYVCGITLNAVSLVNLLICVGLAVEFCAHIVRSFTIVPVGVKRDNESRVRNTMLTIGGSVLKGITVTKIIGISVLALTQSKIFQVYYFRMWALLIFVSALHALVFLPVILSMIGGKGYVESEPDIAITD